MSSRTNPPARIVLTGFSGTGKSAVGPLLAKHFGWTLADADQIVEKRAGKRILDIFRDDGEDAFRDLEGLQELPQIGASPIVFPKSPHVPAAQRLSLCRKSTPAIP